MLVPFSLTQTPAPTSRFLQQRDLGGHVGLNASEELQVLSKDTEGVFSHFLTFKKLRGSVGKIQAELNGVRLQLEAHIEICEKQAVAGFVRRAAGVEKLGGRAHGIDVQERKELLFEVELQEAFFRDVQHPQEDDGAEEREVGIRISGTLERR